jgi:hypothetical protein
MDRWKRSKIYRETEYELERWTGRKDRRSTSTEPEYRWRFRDELVEKLMIHCGMKFRKYLKFCSLPERMILCCGNLSLMLCIVRFVKIFRPAKIHFFLFFWLIVCNGVLTRDNLVNRKNSIEVVQYTVPKSRDTT